MAYSLRADRQIAQPQNAAALINAAAFPGLKYVVNHAVSNDFELFSKAPITNLSGGTLHSPKKPKKQGLTKEFSNAYNEITSIPGWTNTTSEGAFLGVFIDSLSTAWELGSSGNTDHFPFSNALYTDAFWSSRWANGVSLLAGDSWAGIHCVLITVKNGSQKIYHNGRLWHSNTLSGGFTLPSSLVLHQRTTAAHFGLLDVLGDRFIPHDLAISLTNNPWQIFSADEIGFFTSAAGGITGTLSATETDNDTASITGTVEVAGLVSATETDTDTASITGTVAVAGSLSATETGNDSASITGSVAIAGTMAATESGTDTATITGAVEVTGSLSATESATDTAVIIGTVDNGSRTASLNATEGGNDTFAADGTVQITGSMAATESGADTAEIAGAVEVTGTLSATETGNDSISITGSVAGTVIPAELLSAAGLITTVTTSVEAAGFSMTTRAEPVIASFRN